MASLSLTMAMLILFVVSNFFVHINKMPNAFLVPKNFSNVYSIPKICVVSKQESNLS